MLLILREPQDGDVVACVGDVVAFCMLTADS
jgi:hypothetical protein